MVVYVVVAACKRKKPDLGTAVNLLFTTVGATGAVRLLGFVFTDQFAAMARTVPSASVWGLSAEDAVFIMAGALALGWISCSAIWQGFAKL